MSQPPFQPGLYHWNLPHGGGHPLKSFLAWRRRFHPRAPFAFAHAETTLHREFTLADNVLMVLGETPEEVFVDRIRQAQGFLERHGLGVLAAWMPLESYPTALTPEQKTAAALACALLARSQTVLWDARDHKIGDLLLAQVRQLLAQRPQQAVVVVSTCPLIWGPGCQGEFLLGHPQAAPKRAA